MSEPAIPEPTPEEWELSRKLGELAEVEEQHTARELALATVEAELHVFQAHYLGTVGRRYAELDELEAHVAALEAALEPGNGELEERAEAARARAQETADAVDAADVSAVKNPRPPSDSLKKLFRQVARVIHPDLAEDEESRAERERLMAAANRAYVSGDETELAGILREWHESPDQVTGHGPAVELIRTIRQIARVRERIEKLDRQIEELRENDLFRLRDQVEQAEAVGRDLLREMADALEPQIVAARERRAELRGRSPRP